MTYQDYAFSAFAESDLTASNIKAGSTFTMPSNATFELTVNDDDGTMSGDKGDVARDKSGQTASIIDTDGNEVGNGAAVYAEVWFWVVDENDNRYRMIEIEQEGSGTDYFSFVDDGIGLPPPGALLMVESKSNVKKNDGINYDGLGAGGLPTTAAPELEPVLVLAPESDPSNLECIDAVNDAITVSVGEPIIDDDAGGTTGDNALNVLDNDFSATGDFTIIDVDALGIPNQGLDEQVGVNFTVTTSGLRTGDVTLEADGDLLFDGGVNFDDLDFGETDTFTLAYTIEAEKASVETLVFEPIANPEGPDRFAVIIDEDMIDNGVSSIEAAAASLGVESDALVNDNNPTEAGNPPLLWNQLTDAIGTTVRLPTGQIEDEGLFALPQNPVGKEGAFTVEDFVDGIVPQSALDEVRNVSPLRNAELDMLLGQSFVGVVYDSDVSINYDPLEANLQGARYGLFFFTVEEVVPAGALPESGSSSSLNDLIVRIDAVPSDPIAVATVQDLLDGISTSDNLPDFEIDIDPPLGDAELFLDFSDVDASGGTINVFAGDTIIATENVPGGTSTVPIADADGATRIEVEFAGAGTLIEARAEVTTTEIVTDTAEVTVVIEQDGSVGPSTVVAADDFFFLDGTTVIEESSPNPVLANAITSINPFNEADFDPEGDDFFVYKVVGDGGVVDDTPELDVMSGLEFFGWVDAVGGGQLRVASTGEVQFRFDPADPNPDPLPFEISIDYGIMDTTGATDIATISIEVPTIE